MDTGKHEIETLLGALSDALDEEFAALRERALERLTVAVENKATLLSALEDATGKYCRDGRTLPPEWPDLKTLAARCAQANRVNGGAIALNRSLVSGLLDTLYGDRKKPATYDASGKLGQRDQARQVGTI